MHAILPPIVQYMKKLSSFIVVIIGLVVSVTSANAAGTVTCQPIYGGGQTCIQAGNVSVDKKLAHPKTNVLVDNIGINDDKFAPESVVTFQITVTNTGGSRISKVQVKDVFPQYVDFAAGVGNFDSNTKTLSFDLNDLAVNETRTFNIVGKIVPANALPVDRGIVCVVNQATAKDAADSGGPSRDTTQLCVQKDLPVPTVIPVETKGGLKVFPPQKTFTTPATGPEMLPLFALIPTGVLGAFLRKKARVG